MKLLIVTQVVDRADPYLSFFHTWIEELSKHYDHIHVICLKRGDYQLPANVTVHSLGKSAQGRPASGWERMSSRIRYTREFFRLVWKLRAEYDAVFVHMNQEYVLLAGWLWKMLGKRIYLWRNHYAGGLLTDIAAMFATKVFCTSKFSHTAKYKKTVLMPVGVDTETFRSPWEAIRTPRSILFFSRFAPAKRPHVLLEALGILAQEGTEFEASFYGTALPQDAAYREAVMRRSKELALENSVEFLDGVPHSQASGIFSQFEIFVNLSSSGTYDKTLFEAAANGCFVLASSEDYEALVGKRFHLTDAEDAPAVAEKLREILALPQNERTALATQVREKILAGQSLKTLAERLASEIVS